MSSYGKCMGFPINSRSTGKCNKTNDMGKVWEIDTHTFPHSMGAFFPLDSLLYGILYYMKNAWVSHQFPTVKENATELIVWGEPGKSVLILFPYYGRFFPIRFPIYGILHQMGNACVFSLISHNMGKDSQTHPMEKVENWFPVKS